jgi:hypothetical protein
MNTFDVEGLYMNVTMTRGQAARLATQILEALTESTGNVDMQVELGNLGGTVHAGTGE